MLLDRRRFLTRLALLLGGAVIFPSTIVSNDTVFATEHKEKGGMGRKQRDLLEACQTITSRMCVFRTMMIEHYAPDGEIEMSWDMILPPENTIDEATVKFARQVCSLAQN